MSSLRTVFDARMASLSVILIIAVAAAVICLDALIWRRGEMASLVELWRRVDAMEQRARQFAGRPGTADADAGVDGRILVHGETQGLVMAEFQRILTFSTERAGAVVRSVDTPESQAVEQEGVGAGALQRVRLAAEIEVMEQALPDLLYAIETDMPVMIVDGLTLSTDRRIDNAGTESWASGVDRPLSLRLSISAFRGETP